MAFQPAIFVEKSAQISMFLISALKQLRPPHYSIVFLGHPHHPCFRRTLKTIANCTVKSNENQYTLSVSSWLRSYLFIACWSCSVLLVVLLRIDFAMMFIGLLFGVFLCTSALYDGSSDVVDLTTSNFQSKVINSDSVCGHCKAFASEYAKAAKALKGIVNVGGVNMDQHANVGAPYGISGFPTVKIFGADKQKPTEFQGSRTAQAVVDAAFNELKKIVQYRLTGNRSGSKQSSSGSSDDVIQLNDANFDSMITSSDDMWLVEFYAPWCGHCKNLQPHWASAATQLKGKVKVAAIDATVNSATAQRFGIAGFPTIKMFPAGPKRLDEDVVDYTGGRSSSDIVQWAMDRLAENAPPPEIKQLLKNEDLKEACETKQLCIIAVLPYILDCQAKCRNDYLNMLKQLGERFKKNMWGWLWTEATTQTALEESLGLGGFGYPALAAINARKMKFALLRGSFSKDGITEFLSFSFQMCILRVHCAFRELSYGRGSTAPVKGAQLPAIVETSPWDGKDGELPQVDDIDVSDIDLEKDEL
ncbi:Protein disulfide-isomerase A6 [Trichinella britovi]|uniref:protein disulfide-isomerase n=1 Tax=Trichinella britovi TaxID=45882 RepID=A0A0V1CZ40_TRIBR|nr:Protein disulfide-isomerase A6 [Trichinella britovi]